MDTTPINISTFYKLFPSEKKALGYLAKIRWGTKDNITCTRCGGKKVFIYCNHKIINRRRRKYNYCRVCRRYFNALTGTYLADLRVDLRLILYVIYCLWSYETICPYTLGKPLSMSKQSIYNIINWLKPFIKYNTIIDEANNYPNIRKYLEDVDSYIKEQQHKPQKIIKVDPDLSETTKLFINIYNKWSRV